MKTIFHPALPLSREVADSDVDQWVQQGWRKTKPSDSPEPAQATDDKPAKG